ncbi:MAG: hypothetical protein MUC50_21865, partial [Myxococcota bacterium]|nr:hypothetical protein [Myxococcota bacterium]
MSYLRREQRLGVPNTRPRPRLLPLFLLLLGLLGLCSCVENTPLEFRTDSSPGDETEFDSHTESHSDSTEENTGLGTSTDETVATDDTMPTDNTVPTDDTIPTDNTVPTDD